MSSDQQFFLKWNDFQTNMVTSFRHLRDEKSFTDVSFYLFEVSLTTLTTLFIINQATHLFILLTTHKQIHE